MAKQDVTVELFYDSAWNDHTSDVYTRDDIRITHGATDAYSHAQPASCRLTFDDRDGKFNPKNPNSSLFGKIGRNTPVRVTVDTDERFEGETSSWQPRRAIKGDAWTEVRAHGISHRLGQGSTPLRSSLATEVPKQVDTGNLHAYWPCEDGENSTQVAAGIQGVEPLRVTGDVEFAVDAPIPATAPLLRLNDGSLSASVPGTGFRTVFYFDVPDGGLTNNGLIVRLSMIGGDIAHAEMRYLSAGSGNLEITLVDVDGNIDVHTPGTSPEIDGGLWIISLSLTVPLSDVFAAGSVRPVASDGSIGSQTNIGAATLGVSEPGDIKHVRFGGDLGGGVFGHPAITSVQSEFPYDEEGTSTAYLGETAGDRVVRLCDQESVTAAVSGTASDTQSMGAQGIDTLLALLRECASADGGILHDALAQLGLTYRTGRSLYSQDAALTLDLDSGEIAPPLEPVTDDHAVRNDVTVRRTLGSLARSVRESGQLSIEDPPDGVGRYDTSDEINIVSDGFLEHQADWRLHLGTVDEIRFPRVTIDLDAAPDLTDDVAALRPGDRLDLINLPDDVSVDDVSLIVFGWTETIGSHRRKITFNCVPEAPYRVAEVEGGASVGTVGSTSATLNEDLTDAETGVDIDCGAAGAWVHEGTDYDITVNGERMTVTAVGAAAGTFPNETQTLTVTRSVNGVTKTHSNGDDIAMAEPSYIGL